MRLSDTSKEAAWRREIRSFIATDLPEALRPGAHDQAGLMGARATEPRFELEPRPGGSGFKRAEGVMGEYRDKIAERHWIAPAWPREYGGAGLTVLEQFVMNEEFAEAGLPQINRLGVTMAGPTIMLHGTEEQKAEHLPRILSGETEWCQGFSEPGAGSDLASLQTRAVRDGDHYVLNGQKIWTSYAAYSNWMFMLARTDPKAPKHRGISYFILDFTSPGITVLPMADMAGGTHFNQVFFDNVRVPTRNLIGEENRGWYVGTTTLDFERSNVGNAVGARKNVERMVRFAKDFADAGLSVLSRSGTLRVELADRLVEAQVARLLSYRVADMQIKGLVPNYEASVGKLFTSELNQRIARTGIKLVGLHGLSWDSGVGPTPMASQFSRTYASSTTLTIAAGTSEIQRNIIAQRGFGLPPGE